MNIRRWGFLNEPQNTDISVYDADTDIFYGTANDCRGEPRSGTIQMFFID